MDSAVNQHRGRHRGEHHDPVGTALAALWGLGHIVVLTLLGIAVQQQPGTGHEAAAPPARSLPDHEPAA
jgi:hypothetical protein